MATLRNYVVNFYTQHPLAFTLLLGILIPCIVTVYSLEIKQFLSLPPQHLRRWVLRARYMAALSRHYSLEHRANLYSLVVYVCRTAVFVMICLIPAFLLLVMEIIRPWPSQSPNIRFSIIGVATAILTIAMVSLKGLASFLDSVESFALAQKNKQLTRNKILQLAKQLGETELVKAMTANDAIESNTAPQESQKSEQDAPAASQPFKKEAP